MGHSLGAHLVGKVARVFEEETGQKVARVTGTEHKVQVLVEVQVQRYMVKGNKQTGNSSFDCFHSEMQK